VSVNTASVQLSISYACIAPIIL